MITRARFGASAASGAALLTRTRMTALLTRRGVTDHINVPNAKEWSANKNIPQRKGSTGLV